MEALLSRYRNLTVLLVVVVAQLLYLAYQVKTSREDRLIRVWAVTAVTPMAGVVEAVRHNTIGFLSDYFILLDVRDQNRRLKADNDRLRMENIYYRNQLATADHAHALVMFQAQSPSKTVGARVIGNSTVATAKAVFIDRGATSGIEKEMAVVTPEGIVGKISAVYPLVAQVLLVTDPTFKVGVESQKGHVHGVLDCGAGKCQVEQIQNEDKVESNEWFYTSGEDRIFPRGFPVGFVLSSQPGNGTRDVKLKLSGDPGGADEVLVVLQGMHQQIPLAPVVEQTSTKSLPPPPQDEGDAPAQPAKAETQADKVLQKYDDLGKEIGHAYGKVGSTIPNFNQKPNPVANPNSAATPGENPAATTAAKNDSGDDESAEPTDTSPAPARPAPPPVRAPAPTILGARPGTTPVIPRTNPSGQSTPNTQSNLPLGAPRHRTTPPSGSTQSPTGNENSAPQ